MAVASLRRAETPLSRLEEVLPGKSANHVEIDEVHSEKVTPLFEDYPYEQNVYRGLATYSEPSTYTPGREIDVAFEFREGSGLFLIELETDASIDKIANEISQSVADDLTIYRNLHAPEDSLWKFFDEADRIMEINVLDDGTEVSYDEVEGVDRHDVVGAYTIEHARVGFEHEEHLILVDYRNGKLQIQTDWGMGREYIIQLFESKVLHRNRE